VGVLTDTRHGTFGANGMPLKVKVITGFCVVEVPEEGLVWITSVTCPSGKKEITTLFQPRAELSDEEWAEANNEDGPNQFDLV